MLYTGEPSCFCLILYQAADYLCRFIFTTVLLFIVLVAVNCQNIRGLGSWIFVISELNIPLVGCCRDPLILSCGCEELGKGKTHREYGVQASLGKRIIGPRKSKDETSAA